VKKKIIHILRNLPFIFILYKKFCHLFLKFKNSKEEIKYFEIYLKNKKKFINETLPPLNGQKNRKKIINKLIKSKIISKIYETGSYHGSSAEFFSKFKIPVFTCEISKQAYLIAKDRLLKFKKTKISNCNSIFFLNKLKKNNKINFFYLDAHDKILKNPLLKELDIILNKFSKFVIMIDDFQVPHDYEYGYDSDCGKILNLNFIKKIINKNVQIFFPKIKAKFETGYKRGSVFICRGEKCVQFCNSSDDLVKYCH
jgi:hypothetical protein